MGDAHGYDNDHAFSPERVEPHPYGKNFSFTTIKEVHSLISPF
jgi:hypothetical protein